MRIWIMIVAVLGLVLLLAWQYPGAASHDDRLRLLYLILLLFVIGSGGAINRLPAPKVWKYAGIWMLVISALVLVYYALAHLAA
jgi:hypothetical protein